MKLIRQPEGSALCGQCCVAMAAGVSTSAVIKIMGKSSSGTHTREVRHALNILGVRTDMRLRRLSKSKPVLPQKGIVAIKSGPRGGVPKAHWMLTWNGKIYDPEGQWPNGYNNWDITSALEIYDAV